MIKKSLSILFLWLCAVGMWANSVAPQTATEPTAVYTLNTSIRPLKAGYVSVSGNSYAEGSSVWVYTNGYEHYRFLHWTDGTNIVSTETHFYYTMPASNVKLTAVYEYDPTSPADPESTIPIIPHKFTLKSSPVRGGYFNYSEEMTINEGDTHTFYAYSNRNYDFKHWEYKGEVLSTNYSVAFTMPDQDAELVAVFSYNPASPVNPGTNSWNAATGELIMDAFSAGDLLDAIYNTTRGNVEAIKSLTVKGEMTDYDLGEISYLPVSDIDLSRCSKLTTIPAGSFWDNEALRTISLPGSVKYIEADAFVNCSSLTKIYCLAVVPPALEPGVFEATNDFVVYVPGEALSRYEKDENWNQYRIESIETEGQVAALQVTIPQGFKNSFIELYNPESKEKKTYVATEALYYTYKNLPHNTSWVVTVKNTSGVILGQQDVFISNGEAYFVEFESLKQPQDVKAVVLTPNGNDVTSEVQLTWLDNQGTYLSQGNMLTSVLPESKVVLHANLSQTLATEYEIPADVMYEVVSGDNYVVMVLTAMPRIQLTGQIINQRTNEGIAGSLVVAIQTVNGYAKVFNTVAGADGSYTFSNLFNAPTVITAVATNFISSATVFESLTQVGGVANLGSIALQPVSGITIEAAFIYSESVVEGQSVTPTTYTNTANVAYSIRDLTSMNDITQFNVNGTTITLLEEVPQGHTLQVTATSKVNAFEPLVATSTVGSNDIMFVVFNIKQKGQISAAYITTENSTVNGLLYDANGKFIASKVYDDEKSVLFTDLADGTYTLVAMGKSKLFNSIYDLSKFDEAGLSEGKDYIATAVTVQRGVVSTVRTNVVPFFDESQFYDSATDAVFTVNKTQIVAGNYLTLTGRISFVDNDYAQTVSDLKLIVDLPANCSFVNGSVMVGNSVLEDGYTFSDNRLIIPATTGERIRFCVAPAAGDYAPSAFAQFTTRGGKVVTQPIGQVAFSARNLTINVPGETTSTSVPVNGTATSRSKVLIYDGNVQIGQTTANANGNWSATCSLVNPADQSEHPIYARVITPTNDELLSETQMLIYKEEAKLLSTITMLNIAHPATDLSLRRYKTVFDFINPQVRIAPYWYWPDYPEFTFIVQYSDKSGHFLNVGDVVLYVLTSDDQWVSLRPTWSEGKQGYVTTRKFYTEALPVSVCAHKADETGEPKPHIPYVEYVMDPSGYVYEGVQSNRIEGVKATAFFKSTEDAEPVKWNAADYDQENPLYTDENGMYAWDVPNGWWQIRFEKDGYETALSEWLPVPPPQLDVNIPMVQATPPALTGANAYRDGVEIYFDKYMKAETLTPQNVLVSCNGNDVEGEITLLNSETDDEGRTLASRIKFVAGTDLYDEVTLTLTTDIQSYAGVALAETSPQVFTVGKAVTTINVAPVLAVACGEGSSASKLLVSALLNDNSPAATEKLRLRLISDEIAALENIGEAEDDGSYIIQLDENGAFELSVLGLLPGSTAVQFSNDETNADAQTLVKVEEVEVIEQTVAPVATPASGAALYNGNRVILAAADDAKIYYTLDGSEPTTASAVYRQPITITSATTIKAMALVEGHEASDIATFDYTIKQNSQNLTIAEGWNWISHNNAASLDPFTLFKAENFEVVKSQTQGVFRDSQLGLFGNLTSLSPTMAYKVKSSAATTVAISGEAYNARTSQIAINAGWNWIGYPMDEPTAVGNALSNLTPTPGDMIIGLNGSAEYIDGLGWQGPLSVLTPGDGYLLKSANSGMLLFNTSLDAQRAAARHSGRLLVGDAPWSVDIHHYPDVMPMRVQLQRDETAAGTDEFTLAAFCGTECRGIGSDILGVIFLDVHGEGADNISFLALENASGQIFDIEEHVTFTADNIGTYHTPFMLTLSTPADGIRQHNEQLGVWPAVATTEIVVSLGGTPIEQLTITGTDGRTLPIAVAGSTQSTVNITHLPAGTYIVAAQGGGHTFYRKFVKAIK